MSASAGFVYPMPWAGTAKALQPLCDLHQKALTQVVELLKPSLSESISAPLGFVAYNHYA